MFKKVSSITFVAAASLLLLAGCSDNNNNKSNAKESQSSIAKKSSSETTENNSSSSKSTSMSTSETSISNTTTSQSSSSVDSSSSTTTSTETETAPANPAAPYAVDMGQFTTPAVFTIGGANVPSSITLANNGTTTVSFGTRSLNNTATPDDQYAAQVDNIPTKEVRVFSHDGGAVRTVKINTQLTLTNHLSSNGGQHLNNIMYVIVNKNGGFSLITPNYAGNVPQDQMDVLLEAVQ